MNDLAQVNLELAGGLPTCENLDVPAYQRRLDDWVSFIATKTERWMPRFSRCPAEFDDSPGKFRMMAMVTVLQRDLGVRYDPSCQEGPYCALDPRTLFIHGLLDGQGGTCVTIPVLYVAVGRRLGYPLFLVQAREHFFVRWEEPGGERFNIEATTLGFTPRDDDHFRRWPRSISDEDVRQGVFLRNLTPPDERAAFLRERGQCWLEHFRAQEAMESFAEAARLNGRLPGIQCAIGIAVIVQRLLEQGGARTLLATPLDELRLPPPTDAAEAALAPYAIDEVRRIVVNYRQRWLARREVEEIAGHFQE